MEDFPSPLSDSCLNLEINRTEGIGTLEDSLMCSSSEKSPPPPYSSSLRSNGWEKAQGLVEQDLEVTTDVVDGKYTQASLAAQIRLLQHSFEKNLSVIERLHSEKEKADQTARELARKLAFADRRSHSAFLGRSRDRTPSPIRIRPKSAGRRRESNERTPSPIQKRPESSGRKRERSNRPFQLTSTQLCGRDTVRSGKQDYRDPGIDPAVDYRDPYDPLKAEKVLHTTESYARMDYARASHTRRRDAYRSQKEQQALEEAEELELKLRSQKTVSSDNFNAFLQQRESWYRQQREQRVEYKQKLSTAEGSHNENKTRSERMLEKSVSKPFKAKNICMNTPVDYHTLVQEQELERQKRQEARRREQLRNSRKPAGMEENEKRSSQRKEQRLSQVIPKEYTFKAQDPTKVRERLEWRQHQWIARDTERRRTVELEKVVPPEKIPIEERDEEYKAKREAWRQHLLDKQHLQEVRERKRAERHYQKVMEMQIPNPPKTTLTDTKRREKLEAEREQKTRAEKRNEKRREKEKQLQKDMSQSVKVAVRAWENERKSDGAFVELKKTKEEIQQHARSATQNYREKLKETKKKNAEAVKNRLTLVERHDQEIRKQKAKTEAVSALAQAMYGGNSGWLEKANREGIFDEEERILLGIKGDYRNQNDDDDF